jgi:hypothetical protein
MALSEAFDSKIKNMLSAKLAEELEEDVELEEEYVDEEVETTDEAYHEDGEADEDMKEAMYDEDADEDMKKEEFELEEDEEINLEELMAELEEMGNMEEDDPDRKDEGRKKGDDDEMAKEGKMKKDEADEDMKESFDIDALVAEIEADLNEESIDEGATGYDEKVGGKGRTGYDEKVGGKGRTGYDGAVKKLKEERDEALETVKTLQATISEMNLLNSKLLYCNKLFKANALTENQKVKVVDALDKASTAGEAKLVYETLQESFTFTNVEKRAIKEGLGRASKATGTAPQKVITESVDETVSRFQKLANIKLK